MYRNRMKCKVLQNYVTFEGLILGSSSSLGIVNEGIYISLPGRDPNILYRSVRGMNI
jgi:hypothetical protein